MVIIAMLQIAVVKAIAKAGDVETRYNIPFFNVNYNDRIRIIDDIFHKRVVYSGCTIILVYQKCPYFVMKSLDRGCIYNKYVKRYGSIC